ncbi:MAG: hypothetical protein RIT03_800 [Bacteroidota bacterium]
MKQLKSFYPHLLALVGFVCFAVLYFYPVLQGKKIFQSDIMQYTGMAKEQIDFKKANNAELYWTNSAFGGMPTYQLGANYPHEYISKLDHLLRFLPRPADYMFLYFLGFYVLLVVLKIDPLKAFIGALAFGLSTYLVVILGVGHNAKAHAIAYMPLLLAGFILVLRQRYIVGGIITMLAAALEINANHFQMTYYFILLLLVFTIYFVVKYVREQNYKPLFISLGVFVIAAAFAVGANATNLMATAQYADFSTRGKSELTFTSEGKKAPNNNPLDYKYITEYSYGVAESFNLISPRLFGGSNAEKLGRDSKTYDYVVGQGVPETQAADFANSLPLYWGDQPIVAAPAYIGSVVFFLALLALFVDKRKIKYAFLAGILLSLFLSWGKNFPFLTNFFIDNLPLYNKFRAVSSIQVLLELALPAMAIMGLQAFFMADKDKQQKGLLYAAATGLGLLTLLFICKSFFSYTGGADDMYAKNYGPEFMNALKADRRSLFKADLLRSFTLIAAAAAVLWFYLKNKLASQTAVLAVGFLVVADLFFIDKNYVSGDDFLAAREVEMPFQETPADAQILQDTTQYRVFEVSGNLSSSRASYFHHSIGGYHAAKPRRMQQLFDYQIAKNNLEILNMLNVKYIIQTDEKGNEFPIQNPEVNGNAWFVSAVKWVNSADAEMKALTNFNSKAVAIVNKTEFGSELKTTNFVKDSTATIKAVDYKPNAIRYQSQNAQNGLAVFSEMYYADGWNAYIDGKKMPHIRVDYALRALEIPAGTHRIDFKFEPEVVQKGSTIALYSSAGMLVLVALGLYFERRKLWFAPIEPKK